MRQPHRVVIVGFPPAQMLDITGPLDVFAAANDAAASAGRPVPYTVELAAPQAGLLATSSGVPIHASRDVFDATLDADTVLLAGGPGARRAASVADPELVGALARLCDRVARVGSICTGAFALASTGALEGRRATTHWAHFDEFAAAFPNVLIDRDALFVSDGKYHSSAGVSAGIDSALALVEHDLGRAMALEVARELVVFLKRPGGQSQFSAQLAFDVGADDPDRFGELTHWIAAHLDGDLSVELLAGRSAMSERNFARRFIVAMKVAPGKYVQMLRIDAARRHLSDGDLPVARIAQRCGFASAEAMRLAFQRHLNITPTDFRARFQSAGGAPQRGQAARG
ncbi:MAG: AraC family transcriptional regulator [Massilia sp.]|jgi:transcriptional regulator GlxA family with amidase domain|nr:AraC family transcriptional regulator [Massilia sp.]